MAAFNCLTSEGMGSFCISLKKELVKEGGYDNRTAKILTVGEKKITKFVQTILFDQKSLPQTLQIFRDLKHFLEVHKNEDHEKKTDLLSNLSETELKNYRIIDKVYTSTLESGGYSPKELIAKIGHLHEKLYFNFLPKEEIWEDTPKKSVSLIKLLNNKLKLLCELRNLPHDASETQIFELCGTVWNSQGDCPLTEEEKSAVEICIQKAQNQLEKKGFRDPYEILILTIVMGYRTELLDPSGFLGSIWIERDVNDPTIKMPIKLFSTFETLFKNQEIALEVKDKLLDILIQWAKCRDFPSQHKNPILYTFVKEITNHAAKIGLSIKAIELKGLISQKYRLPSFCYEEISSSDVPDFQTQCQKISFRDVKDLDVANAKQMFHFEAIKLFSQFDLTDMSLGKDWGNTARKIIDNINQTTYSLESLFFDILEENRSQKEKIAVRMFKFYSSIALKAFENSDMHTAMIFFSTCHSAPLGRLIKDESISSKLGEVKEQIKMLESNLDQAKSSSLLRKKLDESLSKYLDGKVKNALPPIPYLGLIASDLTFLHDGNSDFDLNKQINLNKLEKTKIYMEHIISFLREIKNVKQGPVQKVKPFSFTDDENLSDIDEIEKTLYQRSVSLFPRKRFSI